jgi:hypothetical protein
MTRLLLVQAFTLPDSSQHYLRPADGAKEAQLMNYAGVAPLLADIDWELHPSEF